MREKLIIGISGSILVDNNGSFAGYERAYVNKYYVESVLRPGCVPYIIPVTDDEDIIK